MTLAYTAHLLGGTVRRCLVGQRPPVDLKFTNPTWPNDEITAHGVDTGPVDGDSANDGSKRHGAFVWLEKADGTVVVIVRGQCWRALTGAF